MMRNSAPDVFRVAPFLSQTLHVLAGNSLVTCTFCHHNLLDRREHVCTECFHSHARVHILCFTNNVTRTARHFAAVAAHVQVRALHIEQTPQLPAVLVAQKHMLHVNLLALIA